MDSIRPGQVWHDTEGRILNAHGAGMLAHEGRFFLYGECRPEGPASLNAQIGVSVYSSADLLRWENKGVALPVSLEKGHPLEAGCKIERPKVLFHRPTGKFIMWWHHDLKGWGHRGAYAGVAVAERPEGPFEFVKIFHPGGCMFRDCTLFLDDDGSAYAVFATDDNCNLAIARLTDDFQDVAPPCVRVFPGRYMEAPCLFKREGIYYLICSGCSSWFPNEARSAWASSVTGPWSELGNPCLGDGAEITFEAQGTFVFRKGDGGFVFMADRWNPDQLQDSRYVWLPIEFRRTVPYDPPRPFVRWRDSWHPSDVSA